MTPVSKTLLSLAKEAQKKFVEDSKGTELYEKNFVTCMSRINKSIDEDKSTSQLIIGTECKQLLVVDTNGSSFVQEFKLRSQPVQILIEGLMDTDHKFIILCRDGKIYEIKNDMVNLRLYLDTRSYHRFTNKSLINGKTR